MGCFLYDVPSARQIELHTNATPLPPCPTVYCTMNKPIVTTVMANAPQMLRHSNRLMLFCTAVAPVVPRGASSPPPPLELCESRLTIATLLFDDDDNLDNVVRHPPPPAPPLPFFFPPLPPTNGRSRYTNTPVNTPSNTTSTIKNGIVTRLLMPLWHLPSPRDMAVYGCRNALMTMPPQAAIMKSMLPM